MLFVDAFLMEQLKYPGNKVDGSECFKPNELLGYVSELKILYYSEIPTEKEARVL